MSAEFWTEERIAWVVEGFHAGRGMSEMGREAGVTRNVIIGKVHRLQQAGLLPHRGNMRPVAAVARQPRVKAAKAPSPAVGAPVPELHPDFAQTIEAVGKAHCRWPIGDPVDEQFRFCGRPKFGESPYCEGHFTVSYQPKKTWAPFLRRR